ncbi:MAG TPA: inositol monophosphatase family protein [Casimicrobiaceae bacterium]|nr:inositol monophosphatase family protein [Casimicrobiaceae bacterium]
MTLPTDPMLAVAVRAARRAASVIVDASRDLKRLPTYSKEQGDIVTAADAESEQAICATITAAFPEHAILGRETGEKPSAKSDSEHRWIVDPLDGTMNFIHGLPYYAVSIALVKGGELTHAVVLDPTRDELFTAVKGRGAQLNNAPIRTSGCTRLQEALIGTVMPTRKSPRLPRYLPIFTTLAQKCALRRAGSCALDLAYVAAARMDGFFLIGLRPWQIAAGALLVSEAGGRLGDLAGTPDFLRAGEAIAAAPGVFNPLREAIAAAPLPGGAM